MLFSPYLGYWVCVCVCLGGGSMVLREWYISSQWSMANGQSMVHVVPDPSGTKSPKHGNPVVSNSDIWNFAKGFGYIKDHGAQMTRFRELRGCEEGTLGPLAWAKEGRFSWLLASWKDFKPKHRRGSFALRGWPLSGIVTGRGRNDCQWCIFFLPWTKSAGVVDYNGMPGAWRTCIADLLFAQKLVARLTGGSGLA